MSKTNQKGLGVIEALLLVVVVGLLGVIGWYVYRVNQDNTDPANSPSASVTQNTVPEINNSQDLKAGQDYLNSQDLDKELDTSEIDNALKNE